jgi:hypothetical protein
MTEIGEMDAVWAVIARALDVSQFRRENMNEQQAVGLWAPRSVIRATLGFGSLFQEADYAAMRRLPVSGASMPMSSEETKGLRVAVTRGEKATQGEKKRNPFYCRRALWIARSPRCFSGFNELAIAQAPLPFSLTNVSGTSIAMQAGGEIDQNSKRQPKEPAPPGFPHSAR